MCGDRCHHLQYNVCKLTLRFDMWVVAHTWASSDLFGWLLADIWPYKCHHFTQCVHELYVAENAYVNHSCLESLVLLLRYDDLLYICLLLCRSDIKLSHVCFQHAAWQVNVLGFIFSWLGLAEIAVRYSIGCGHPAVSHTGWHVSCTAESHLCTLTWL